MGIKEDALKLHKENTGKLEIKSKVKIENLHDLSLAYTPGVAYVCKEIEANKEEAYTYTSKANMVAVITDGSAVLGLGNIGPYGAIPVMEGKSILLKELAGVDSIPLCLDTQDTEEIIKTCKYLAPTLGAINLEDISAPRCVTIERRLIEEMDIPVFHDDQHGTSIIVAAAFLNIERFTKRKLSEMRIVLSGTGAAGSMVAKMLKKIGVKEINAFNINGVVDKKNYDSYDFLIKELIDDGVFDTPKEHDNSLASLLKGADAFIGVSAPNLVSKEMVKSMNSNSIIFAMANPTPEISYDDAKEAGAFIVGSGRSDYPNQINNVLAFPGIFKGALSVRATKINEEMKLAAAYAIANIISDEELKEDYIVPSAFDKRVVDEVSKAVALAAIKTNVSKIK
ncbi:MAG: NADP-dependent malic enzyme [Erysipelotrichaceae bacterium]|nr:NADP-dependent malic enzyme [Erysipelotrichaceae bacterium]